MGQQPVDTGHTHIVQPHHLAAQDFRGQRRFLCHRNITGAAGGNDHLADAVRLRDTAHNAYPGIRPVVQGNGLTDNGSSLRGQGSDALQSSYPNILVKPVQLPDAHLWARQVLILADKSEVRRYAEELVGTRHMINTLRANTHEFLNKLQVISGLLQMGRVEDAQGYIGDISAVHEHITGPVMKLIRNTSVAALILGKSSNMREQNVSLVLMNNSTLPEHSRYLSTDDLVTVVGNLLENAIEATAVIPANDLRAVALQITEDEKGLLIMVSDTGEGISPENLPHIFERGFSTKAATGRGVGMRNIQEIVESHDAAIDVDTEPGSGTTFTLIFSRERGGNV